MTANKVYSSTFYEDTVDGYGAYISFDSCGYFIKDIIQYRDDNGVILRLRHCDRQDDSWFICYTHTYDTAASKFASTLKQAQAKLSNVQFYSAPFPAGDAFFDKYPFICRSRLLIKDS